MHLLKENLTMKERRNTNETNLLVEYDLTLKKALHVDLEVTDKVLLKVVYLSKDGVGDDVSTSLDHPNVHVGHLAYTLLNLCYSCLYIDTHFITRIL